MEKETLRRLELLNQLRLTAEEKEDVIDFFARRDADTAALSALNTEATVRMVHVMPIQTVVREDTVSQPFSREDLQVGAPETDEGYWCVPRVLE